MAEDAERLAVGRKADSPGIAAGMDHRRFLRVGDVDDVNFLGREPGGRRAVARYGHAVERCTEVFGVRLLVKHLSVGEVPDAKLAGGIRLAFGILAIISAASSQNSAIARKRQAIDRLFVPGKARQQLAVYEIDDADGPFHSISVVLTNHRNRQDAAVGGNRGVVVSAIDFAAEERAQELARRRIALLHGELRTLDRYARDQSLAVGRELQFLRIDFVDRELRRRHGRIGRRLLARCFRLTRGEKRGRRRRHEDENENENYRRP